jgi:hypothetical protein
MLTLQDIAKKTGKTRRAIAKKSFLLDYFIREVSTGGRPVKFYDENILERLGYINPHADIQNIDNPTKPVRKERSDKSAPRLISEKLETELIKQTFTYYINQARLSNVLLCCKWACNDFANDILKELQEKNKQMTLEEFAQFFYLRRLMRKDKKYYEGPFHRDNWKKLWSEKHDVNKFNAQLPSNRWEEMELLVNAGIIGEGFGAGLIWVVDGTQLDLFVDNDGKKQTMNYLAITDGITGMIMYVKLLQNGERIQDVASAFSECLRIHGKPAWGVMMDNGRAFRSAEIRNYISSWYTPSELYDIENNSLRNKIFNNQHEPYLYPLAKIPRYPFKAKIERTFDEINRHPSENYPVSYIGTRDSRAVSHELGSNPILALEKAPAPDKAFANFIWWIYSDFINRQSGGKLKYFQRLSKQKPTLLNAWLYFGGKFNLDEENNINKIELKSASNLTAIEQSKIYEIYATAEDSKKHRVKASLGHANLIENNINYNINSDSLDLSVFNKQITVVIDGKDAYIFLEHDNNSYDERVPHEGDIYFVGMGFDATIRNEEDLKYKIKTQKVRKNMKDAISEKIKQLTYNSEQSEFNEISSAEYHIIPQTTRPTELSDKEIKELEDDFEKTINEIENDDIDDFLNF